MGIAVLRNCGTESAISNREHWRREERKHCLKEGGREGGLCME